jgi:hypothetical protein
MHFSEEAYLPVLLRDELLTHSRYLDVQIICGKVEIGPEELCWFAVLKLDCELARLVVPLDFVEIQESRELPLALVSEVDLICRIRRVEWFVTQLAWASVLAAGAVASSSKSLWSSPSSSC